MNKVKLATISRYVLSGIMLLAGVAHMVYPVPFVALIGDFLPWPLLLVYLSGLAELVLGVGLLLRKWAAWSAVLVGLMLIVYTPLHVYDLMQEVPFVGTKQAAVIRLVIQALLLVWVWFIWRGAKEDLKDA